MATETNTAGAITRFGQQIIAVGIATETDTAGTITAALVRRRPAAPYNFLPPLWRIKYESQTKPKRKKRRKGEDDDIVIPEEWVVAKAGALPALDAAREARLSAARHAADMVAAIELSAKIREQNDLEMLLEL